MMIQRILFTSLLLSVQANVLEGFIKLFQKLFEILIWLYYTSLVLTIIFLAAPIITAIMGVIKKNRNLRGFSQAYALCSTSVMTLITIFGARELLSYYLVLTGICALPLLILLISKKNG